MAAVAERKPANRSERFFSNVLWNWLGVAVNFFIIAVLSPYIIRKIGDEGYGIWMLVLGLIDYYWLLDLGFRSATLKYCAHYRATGEPEKINEIINTALFYGGLAAAAFLPVTVFASTHIVGFFQITPQYRATFSTLVVIVGLGWGLGIVFNMFGACLEGFQRFDIVSRIWILTNALRAFGCVFLLFRGYGLIELAEMVVASQVTGYCLSYLAVRRVFPQWRFSLLLVKISVMRQMVSYGVHTLVATVADRCLMQSAPLLIGHFRPPAFVGYFGLPVRLLQYAADMVMRVAMVTISNASELAARGEMEAVSRLGIYANRYSLTIFLPMACVLVAYGQEIIRVWIGPVFAAHSGPLLPVLVLGSGFAIAGQYNSGSILYGLGKHGGYARGLMVEAILNVALLFWVIPRYGILGAAWVTSLLMILNRGLLLPWLLCQWIGADFREYMQSIYLRPVLVAMPVVAIAFLLKKTVLPGDNLLQLLAAVSLIGITYGTAAFFVCLGRQHRASMLNWGAGRLKMPVLARIADRL